MLIEFEVDFKLPVIEALLIFRRGEKFHLIERTAFSLGKNGFIYGKELSFLIERTAFSPLPLGHLQKAWR